MKHQGRKYTAMVPKGLISVEPMKSSWHRGDEATLGSLMLNFYGILVSELNRIQRNVVADCIGGSKE